MPIVNLSDATDAKLKALVVDPFEETRESMIDDLVDAELERRKITSNGSDRNATSKASVESLNPDRPDNLTHSRVLSATVDTRPIHRPKWNGVMNDLHVEARKRLGSFEAIRRASAANLREGKYEDEGYTYLPNADLSVQGVDSNLAWSHALRLARELGVSIEITLEWRQKKGAARPGQKAILAWKPSPK